MSKIPSANKEIKVKKKSFLKSNIFLFIELVLVLILLALLFFLNQYNRSTQNQNVETERTITDNSISKIDAETRNLKNIKKVSKDINDLEFSILNSVDLDLDLELSYKSTNNLELLANGDIQKLFDNPPTDRSIIFISKENRENISFTNEELVTNLSNYILDNELSNIELDVSLTYINGFEDILENLSEDLNSEDIKLVLYLYPLWSDEVNYELYTPITNLYHQQINLVETAALVNELKFMAYDYTGPLNILPGPITPKSWFEQIIQYIISKEVPREKITIGINSQSYIWPEREIATDNIIENYSVLSLEAKSQSFLEFNNFIASNSIKAENREEIDENIYRFIENNVKNIAIAPSLNYINELVRITSEYGIRGFYLK